MNKVLLAHQFPELQLNPHSDPLGDQVMIPDSMERLYLRCVGNPLPLGDWVAKVTLVFSRLSWAEAVSITVLSALTTLFQVIAFSVLFNGFGIQLPLLYVVFMAVFSNLSLIISLTPANLGVKELIIWMLVSHLDISAVDMISVMLVDRLLQILLVIGTCLAGYRSLGFIRSAGQPVEPESASGPQ